MVLHEDRVLRLLADAGNRAIVAILREARSPLDANELADRLVTEEPGVFDPDEYERAFQRTLVSLHHHRLPKLADAGLLEYDRDERTVADAGYAAAEVEWFDLEAIDELLDRFRAGRGAAESSIGVVEGSESVYRYARRLVAEAEEELFLIYASTALLEEECVPSAREAIERGVRFCVGSGNPDVREFFRTRLPEATIWEPQLDWANDPTTYPQVDRLVFADREAIVVGLIDEPAEDDPAAGTGGVETAMVGRGETSPLVVFARELLGPRLDHLDCQSENFRSGLSSKS